MPDRAAGSYSQGLDVVTIAGACHGYSDGADASARFYQPGGICSDSSGNLYVADSYNQVIRKITPAGVVSTIAGTWGDPGFQDGPGGAAQFNSPTGLVVDSQGVIYVADTDNCTIRKILPNGMVSTLAGNPSVEGSTDGIGQAASFTRVTGVALTPAGNLVVADFENGVIRQVTPEGTVTTLAGKAQIIGDGGDVDGALAAARFGYPCGVAVDSSGNIFVLDEAGFIRKIAGGQVTTLAILSMTAYDQGLVQDTPQHYFSASYGLAVDSSGNLYFPEPLDQVILKLSPSGEISTFAGTTDVIGCSDGAIGIGQFDFPTGICLAPAGGVYVADASNQAIRYVSATGVVTTLAGVPSRGAVDGAASASKFWNPNGVAEDPLGDILVADCGNDAIRKIDVNGSVTTLAGAFGQSGSVDGNGAEARFSALQGIAADGLGNAYVSDGETIRMITPSGEVTTVAGVAGIAGWQDGEGSGAFFYMPGRLTVDAQGNLLICDQYNGVLRQMTPAGIVTTLSIQFPYTPLLEGVAVDASGTIFAADSANDVIYEIGADNIPTVLAGTFGTSGYSDGVGSQALFGGFSDLVIDTQGNLFTFDTGNQVIREISPSGQVTTVAGAPGVAGGADGMGFAARFDDPYIYPGLSPGLCAGTMGLIIADYGNSAIRLATPTNSQPRTSFLSNGSTFAQVGNPSNTLTAGFTCGGPFPKNIVIRGVGPTLANYGVEAVLPDPALTLFQGQVSGGAIAGWGSELGAEFQAIGAFSLIPDSADTAESLWVDPGSYSVQVGSVSGSDSGTCLFEIYDADSNAPTNRLTNLSARTVLPVGATSITEGFVVEGTGTETLLIRGIGPSLANFGITGTLQGPRITLFDQQGNVIASMGNWEGSPALGLLPPQASIAAATPAIMQSAGAFPLGTGSGDSALVAALPPGAYTIVLDSSVESGGACLVEVYELP